MKIERLTQEQEARFPEFVDRWRKIGLSTEPTDRDAAYVAVKTMYRCGGLSPPKRIVFCGSPLSQAIVRALIKHGASVRASVWDSVGDSVWASVRDSVWDSVRVSVRASVWGSVGDSVWDSVRDSVYGQHDAAWLAFYSFFRDVCGLTEETQKLSGLFLLAESAGWALPHQHICWVSERHTTLERNARGQLHCDGGPAVAYPDGWSIWALNGLRVPQWLAEKRASEIDCLEFAKIENAEVRREFVRKVGIERISMALGAKKLDSKGDYELLAIDLKGSTGVWPYLKMRNPSIGVWHLEAVPKGTTTVVEALNWRNGGEFEHIIPMT